MMAYGECVRFDGGTLQWEFVANWARTPYSCYAGAMILEGKGLETATDFPRFEAVEDARQRLWKAYYASCPTPALGAHVAYV